jgi:hypothetical protein
MMDKVRKPTNSVLYTIVRTLYNLPIYIYLSRDDIIK